MQKTANILDWFGRFNTLWAILSIAGLNTALSTWFTPKLMWLKDMDFRFVDYFLISMPITLVFLLLALVFLSLWHRFEIIKTERQVRTPAKEPITDRKVSESIELLKGKREFTLDLELKNGLWEKDTNSNDFGTSVHQFPVANPSTKAVAQLFTLSFYFNSYFKSIHTKVINQATGKELESPSIIKGDGYGVTIYSLEAEELQRVKAIITVEN